MKINANGSTEAERFDRVMSRLLSIPANELQRRRLKAEEKIKKRVRNGKKRRKKKAT